MRSAETATILSRKARYLAFKYLLYYVVEYTTRS